RRLRGGHGVDRVLEHDHAVRHAHAERASASALTDHRGDYRDRDPKPLHDRLGDRGGNAPLLGSGARVRAGRVDERDDRKAELGRLVRQTKRLAVALGMHHPPVPAHARLQAAAFLVAEEHGRAAMPGTYAPHERRVGRGPVKPIAAPGSAMLMSPSNASDAAVPPNVGSVRTEKNGTPASCSRPTAAFTFASCISARTPSCMRAPPDADTSTYGVPVDAACSIPRARRSPATMESVPPTNPKSKAASQIGFFASVHVPV